LQRHKNKTGQKRSSNRSNSSNSN